jgi:GH24 family phage-related lysozyme (muramidase)
MKTSSEGIALIREFEGCRLKSYQDQKGVWTIGYGTTSATGFGQVTKGQCIAQELADEWLITGLVKYENTVRGGCTRTPSQSQFDAMVSLCYNIGQGAFLKSTVLRRHNAGQFTAAAESFLLWNKVNKIANRGLTRRRVAEMALYARQGRDALVTAVPVPFSPLPETVPVPAVAAVPPARPSLWQRLFKRTA